MSRRESILARLVEVAAGVEGVNAAVRNETALDELSTPLIAIFDADETVDDADNSSSRPSNAPVRVGMTPEVFIVLGDKPEAVGTEINAVLENLQVAVVGDATLRQLTGIDMRSPARGDIRYNGCVTSLSVGRQMFGDCAVSFTFTYPLRFD
jgi:hypothetical protein